MDQRVIDISNLTKHFDENLIFRNFSMYLNKGENLVVLGRSGVGKSVLLKCITGLLPPDGGNINVLDKNIVNLSEKELNMLRGRMGYLFQSGALYDSMTIYENLLFPLERNKFVKYDNKETVIYQALESVGLSNAANLMPSELSGGMKKRAGLARTLVMKPEIILYDEPTTGLDPFTAQEISELIVAVRREKGNSSVVVTHDMKCTEIVADRIIVLGNGESIAEGSFEELKNSSDERVENFFQ